MGSNTGEIEIGSERELYNYTLAIMQGHPQKKARGKNNMVSRDVQ